jgi:hypothetical protein
VDGAVPRIAIEEPSAVGREGQPREEHRRDVERRIDDGGERSVAPDPKDRDLGERVEVEEEVSAPRVDLHVEWTLVGPLGERLPKVERSIVVDVEDLQGALGPIGDEYRLVSRSDSRAAKTRSPR